jgi:HEAT repeat protein
VFRPLLENLADEPDMVVRKSLVDILSALARNDLAQLGACVTDSRWYFVRNVVAILASTKSPAVLTYLERTLRYPDARVRRETIRGLSVIQDRRSNEMLVASLSDADMQNVQLAARYLGEFGDLGAVSALETVVRGEGQGNRETAPRVEAVEALGRLGATHALPLLESLAGRRTLMGGGRGKELRVAANAAVEAIKKKGAAR